MSVTSALRGRCRVASWSLLSAWLILGGCKSNLLAHDAGLDLASGNRDLAVKDASVLDGADLKIDASRVGDLKDMDALSPKDAAVDMPPDARSPMDMAASALCIDLPASHGASPKPSLQNVGAPRVIWSKTLSGSGFAGRLTLASGHLALSGDATLWILDRDGNVTGNLVGGPAWGPKSPTPIADREGNFYWSAGKDKSYVYSVSPNGTVRWKKQLGSNQDMFQEITYTSNLVMNPEGVLFFAASDGFVYALQSKDGSVVWQVPGGLNSQGIVGYVDLGNGDLFRMDHRRYSTIDGSAKGALTLDGRSVWEVPVYSGIMAGYYVSENNEIHARSFMLDGCGRVLWSLPNQAGSFWEMQLVGFDDQILVRDGVQAENWYIYTATGQPIQGPIAAPGRTELLGADGTLYAYDCRSSELVAYSWSGLDKLWSLHLDMGCDYRTAVLADDGVLYLASGETTPIQVVAVQTQSPGLADTAMPAWLYNNRRTGWLE